MPKAWLALVAIALALSTSGAVRAAERWQTFLRPPPLSPAPVEGRVAHEGANIWFAAYGSGRPVILLHGAGGDSGNFGFQVPALIADGRRVIVIDSRGQGRSTMGERPLGYELMESDVVAVMDKLGLRRADIVGWSDGAIIGLVMAMKYPDRTRRIFAFSPNTDPSGLRPDFMSQPLVAQAIAWSQEDYARISPTPGGFGQLAAALERMVQTEPNYTATDLARIRGPAIAIVDGDHEELITPEHTRYIARTIPGAKLIILPGVSHFAPLQAPDEFNRAMLAFIDGR